MKSSLKVQIRMSVTCLFFQVNLADLAFSISRIGRMQTEIGVPIILETTEIVKEVFCCYGLTDFLS